MELHTVGVDGGYTQQDVIQMAECLTGWTIHEPRKDPQFFFDEKIHAEGKKVVMGRTFNYGGEKDGEEALKMLASQPTTAKFISTELARHFVSDNPPPALVDAHGEELSNRARATSAAVLRTMIYSPEFWSKDAYRAKVKTPFELVASTARALNAEVTITLAAHAMGRPHGRASVSVPAADGLFRQVRNLGEYGRAAESPEFCAGVRRGQNGRRDGRPEATCWATTLSKDPNAALARLSRNFWMGKWRNPRKTRFASALEGSANSAGALGRSGKRSE